MRNVCIKTVKRDCSLVLKKNIVLYGANNSGKTTVLLDLLKMVKPYIPSVIAFAPTADSNNSLKGVIPDLLIKRNVDIATIKDVYERQKEASMAYNNSNDMEVLQSLFKRVAGRKHIKIEEQILDIKNTMDKKLITSIPNVIDRKKQAKKIEERSKSILVSLYKRVIKSTEKILLKMKLTDTESQAIKFINFNPNVLLIFDDCASVFTKKFQNDPIIKDLFYNYRHSYFTIILTFQDDLGLESFLRKNASLSFFTTRQCADAYFERGSNSFSKDMKNGAQQMSDIIFDSKQPAIPEFSKLLYIRNDPEPFRYFCAELHDTFRFGSKALWDLCDKVEKNKRASNAISSTFGKY